MLGLRAVGSLASAGEQGPLGAALEALTAKIRRAVGGDGEGLVRLEREVSIAATTPARGAEQAPAGAVLLPEILAAIESRRKVELVYHSASRGATTPRAVDPYGLLNHGGSWYLVGRCHVHDDVRMFKLERVLDLRASGKPAAFTLPADFDLETYRRNRLTPTASGEPVRIWVSAEAVPRALAIFPRERIRQSPARGGLELTLDVPPSAWLVGWILGLGPHAEAISPRSLRADVVAAAEALLDSHGQKP
jgi:predicted DNA-binding transcriptional regulator YafY